MQEQQVLKDMLELKGLQDLKEDLEQRGLKVL